MCAKCVAESDVDADVTHATEGEGSTPDNMPWDVLLNKVITHYEDAHTTSPQTVTPGASLLNGTTISGNLSFHAGNESIITASNAQLTPSSLELTSIGGTVSFLGGFDISSADFLQSFDVSGPSSRPRDITFNPSGTKMFIIGSSSNKVFQYPLNTAFDISTASSVSESINVSNDGPFSPRGVAFSNDGLKMFPIGDSTDSVYEFNLSSSFDVGTASNDAFRFFQVDGESKDPEGVTFNNDGTKMFIIDRAGASVNTAFAFQYSLSTAFDISTASYNSVKLDVTSQESSPKSLAFNDDGTKVFITGSSPNSIFEYKMNSSFDIGTASYTGRSLDIGQQDGAPQGVRFKPDGKSMFIVGNQSDSVHQYLLGNLKIK